MSKTSFSKSHPGLYSKLNAWRNSIALRQNARPYQILPQKSLQLIAETLPTNMNALGAISGLGKARLRYYGDAIVKMVVAYMIENDMEIPLNVQKEDRVSGKDNTRQITRRMFDSGMSVQRIARERGLTESTIVGHLSVFVNDGEISLEKILDPESIMAIGKYFIDYPEISISEAFRALNEKYPYAILRLVKDYLHKIRGN
jgi:uncharacterized protein YpbB